MSSRAAAEIAAAMLGAPVDIHDPAVNDALGELCKYDDRRMEEQLSTA